LNFALPALQYGYDFFLSRKQALRFDRDRSTLPDERCACTAFGGEYTLGEPAFVMKFRSLSTTGCLAMLLSLTYADPASLNLAGAHLAPVTGYSGTGRVVIHPVPGGLLIEASMSTLPEPPCQLRLHPQSLDSDPPRETPRILGTFIPGENGMGVLGVVEPRLTLEDVLWRTLEVVCEGETLARGRIQPPDPT
jgi:hypothetical protein